MKLTVKPIKNYCNVNSWDYSDRVTVLAGQQQSIHFQLWNEDRDMPYHPQVGATMSLKFPRAPKLIPTGPWNSNVVQNPQDVIVAAIVPASNDSSVWTTTLTSAQADLIVGGGVIVTVVESGVSKSYTIYNVIEKVMP